MQPVSASSVQCWLDDLGAGFFFFLICIWLQTGESQDEKHPTENSDQLAWTPPPNSSIPCFVAFISSLNIHEHCSSLKLPPEPWRKKHILCPLKGYPRQMDMLGCWWWAVEEQAMTEWEMREAGKKAGQFKGRTWALSHTSQQPALGCPDPESGRLALMWVAGASHPRNPRDHTKGFLESTWGFPCSPLAISMVSQKCWVSWFCFHKDDLISTEAICIYKR